MIANKIDFPLEADYVQSVECIESGVALSSRSDVLQKGDVITQDDGSFDEVFESPEQIRLPTSVTSQEESSGNYNSGHFVVRSWDYENMPLGDTQWVSPDGDDSNVGTKEEPVASIQTAIDRLDKALGHSPVKTVRLEGDRLYEESVIVNVRNLHIIGSSVQAWYKSGGAVWAPGNDGADGPNIFVTSMTREAAEQFIDDGGLDASYNEGDGTFTYQGADLEREKRDEFKGKTSYDIGFQIKRIQVTTENATIGGNGITFMAAPAHASGDSEARMSFLILSECHITNTYDDGLGCYMKNIASSIISSSIGTKTILDNCYSTKQKLNHNPTFSTKSNIIYRNQGTGLGSGEVRIWDGFDIWPYLFQEHADLISRGTSSFKFFSLNSSQLDRSTAINVASAESFYIGGVGGMGTASKPIAGIEVDSSATFQTDGDMYVRRVECGTFDKPGSGDMDLGRLKCAGNASIAAGTSNVIRGGIIEGDLDVSSGASVTLYNVTVEGNLEGSGSITMNGGGYLGDNNNGNLTYNDLKTT